MNALRLQITRKQHQNGHSCGAKQLGGKQAVGHRGATPYTNQPKYDVKQKEDNDNGKTKRPYSIEFSL